MTTSIHLRVNTIQFLTQITRFPNQNGYPCFDAPVRMAPFPESTLLLCHTFLSVATPQSHISPCRFLLLCRRFAGWTALSPVKCARGTRHKVRISSPSGAESSEKPESDGLFRRLPEKPEATGAYTQAPLSRCKTASAPASAGSPRRLSPTGESRSPRVRGSRRYHIRRSDRPAPGDE